MRWVKDQTGKFLQRPHYEPAELDWECEQIIREFLRSRYHRIEYPVSTDDLTCLLERDAEDLDLYADLTGEPGHVEGVTEFYPGRKPAVKIAKHLTEARHLENRLRTTLTHEYGHVRFHGFMFEIAVKPRSLFEDEPLTPAHANRCKRDSLIAAPAKDWMEWQAGYICGALLMPAQALGDVIADSCKVGPNVEGTPEGQELIRVVSEGFQTSQDAARVRLLQRKLLLPEGSVKLPRLE